MVSVQYTFVFDLDGVIYRGDEPQPHASETVRDLRHLGHKVFFFTNNATRSRHDYCSKLSGMYIPTTPEEVMTSAYATALYLKETGKTGAEVYAVGEDGLKAELASVGLKVRDGDYDGSVDFVVAGLDREFSYAKLMRAQQAIIGGARFIATNTDTTFPIEEGRIIPGGGSLVAAIQAASGVDPFVVGKPETSAIEMILQSAQTSAENSIMVGDRLETDILGGNRAGMRTVLITTGVSSESDAKTASAEMQPTHIIHDLAELLDIAKAVR